MSKTDDYTDHFTTCWGCEIEITTRSAVAWLAHLGGKSSEVERVHVPMCRACKRQRTGYACEECGTLRDTIGAASRCCSSEQDSEATEYEEFEHAE